jgi:hypothetical protein
VGGGTVDQNTVYYHDLLMAIQAPSRTMTAADLSASFFGFTFL